MKKKKFKSWEGKKQSILSGFHRKLKKNPTKGEAVLVSLFEFYGIHAVFQKGWLIKKGTFYISDFYLPFCKTVIEVDGSCHDGLIQKQVDRKKDEYYKSRGFKVLRLKM